ncbi:MAG: quinone oxidoreductase, partial [Rhodococcus sp. (in: high G+C Gram-positive bacteria)]
MVNAIRFHEIGTPSVMRWEEIEIGRPGVGEVRVRHEA